MADDESTTDIQGEGEGSPEYVHSYTSTLARAAIFVALLISYIVFK